MSIFCPKCGTQLPDGAVACSNCGAQLGAAPVQPQPQPAAPVYQAPVALAAVRSRTQQGRSGYPFPCKPGSLPRSIRTDRFSVQHRTDPWPDRFLRSSGYVHRIHDHGYPECEERCSEGTADRW